MSRAVTVSLVAVAALAAANSAPGTVKRVLLWTPVTVGEYTSLTVKVTPKARCTIEVLNFDTATGVPILMAAKGLGSKAGSRITWRWRVGKREKTGIWPIFVRCGKSGTLQTRIRVMPQ